jgi:hypothetical protein
MPDDPGMPQGAEATPATSTAPPGASPPAAPAGAGFIPPAGAGAAPMGGGQSAVAPPAASPEYESVRDVLARAGVREQFADDNAAVQALISRYHQAEQLQQLAAYGQEYVQHAGEFGQYLAQRREEAARRAAAEQAWFKPPEYDPRWADYLQRNPQTGRLEAAEGAPPGVVEKYHAWAQHQRGFLDRFSQDPIGAIKPGLEQTIEAVARRMLDERVGQLRAEQEAATIIARNNDWLVAADPQTGRKQMTPQGVQFYKYVGYLTERGMTDARDQEAVAKALVTGEMALAQLAQLRAGQAPPGGVAGVTPPGQHALPQQLDPRAAFLAQAQARGPTPGAAPMIPPGNVQGAAVPQGPLGARALAQEMLADLTANGFRQGEDFFR